MNEKVLPKILLNIFEELCVMKYSGTHDLPCNTYLGQYISEKYSSTVSPSPSWAAVTFSPQLACGHSASLPSLATKTISSKTERQADPLEILSPLTMARAKNPAPLWASYSLQTYILIHHIYEFCSLTFCEFKFDLEVVAGNGNR